MGNSFLRNKALYAVCHSVLFLLLWPAVYKFALYSQHTAKLDFYKLKKYLKNAGVPL